jgi:LuxR family transcriptional regulator, maltose regulon positive regulatory protein
MKSPRFKIILFSSLMITMWWIPKRLTAPWFFLLEHMPPQMHLIIATRARDQLAELRAADLRFTPAEAAEFLNRVMGLHLQTDDIAALETRTEGWIAGLQLAALALQGTALAKQGTNATQSHQDTASFIKSFTGSNHFVLDYLIEEVLQQQSENIQKFLLRTSILDRMCSPLCEAVMESFVIRDPLSDSREEAEGFLPGSRISSFRSGQSILEYLERANLFIVPLENERHWYRYHHLFGDLLRKRLGQALSAEQITELNIRASEWYEHNNMPFEAFHHASAANDVERAERLIESKEMDLHLNNVVMPILDWLAALPQSVLDARPQLWVRSATLALMAGQSSGVEEKLQTAEKALQGVAPDEKTRDLIGQMACARVHPQSGYVDKLLAAFPLPEGMPQSKISNLKSEIVEPLSQRESEVLQLIAQGLSNHEICERLFRALDTVKGHNRRIFDKLQVQRRTEAIARARELGLL